jgi:hypothetical protein
MKKQVLGKRNSLLSFDSTLTAQKSTPLKESFVAAGTCLPSHCLATHRKTHRLSSGTSAAQKTTPQTNIPLFSAFVPTGMCLPRMGGICVVWHRDGQSCHDVHGQLAEGKETDMETEQICFRKEG